MDKSFSEISFDVALEGYDAHVSDSVHSQKEQEIKLCAFIDKLPHLNDIDKYWARKDTEEELKKVSLSELSEKVQELQKKYQFYDLAGQLRASICSRAPGENGKTVCNLIDTSILNISSEGRDRRWKLKELMALDKATSELGSEKDLMKFKQRQEAVKDSVVSKILMLFDAPFAEKFKKFQEEMGAPQFWIFTREMSPAEFPNFTTTFNFQVPRDFLKKLTQTNLPQWPEKLRKALTHDAEEMLSSEVFDQGRRNIELSRLKSSKTVADFVARLLELKKLRDIERLKLDREREIEKRKTRTEEEKKKQDELEKKEQQKKEQTGLVQKKELQKKEEEEKKKKEKEKGVDLGAEKQKILEFYDKAIEHAEKVKEECANWGVRPDDIDYWGQEGAKNRMSLLKKRGTWNDYVRFNSNDKYIPSNARGDGFRFRWLNANTGSRISAAGADAGIKYMQRYKESGYQLCVLAGAFSIDWAGSDSIVDTPVRFLEKMHSLRSNLIGKSVKK